MTPGLSTPLPALRPRGAGHQLVVYGDACAGVAGHPHAANFDRVNGVLARLDPPPEFTLFTGDEVIGLTPDMDALRAQWRHFLGTHPVGRAPMWHVTGNHTTYDAASEAVFAEMLPHLPRNGPPGQEGLAYWVRHGDLLLVAVHTLPFARGGEGHVETEWLDRVLTAHADARYRFVAGHHPVHPVNGFAGPWQREIGPPDAMALWDVLVRHRVTAYLCSHILAFDAQVQQGVLQITTAGAGTAHRMPEGVEYLHFVQMAVDEVGLRAQVIDDAGVVRERWAWPPVLPPGEEWPALRADALGAWDRDGVLALRLSGQARPDAAPQTLLEAGPPDALPVLWVGLRGPEKRLTVTLRPQAGRSPHYWFGPAFSPSAAFGCDLLLQAGLGPGGMLWRGDERAAWTSLQGAGAWGPDRLPPCSALRLGDGVEARGWAARGWAA